MLSRLQLAPLVLPNGVGDLSREYAYLHAHYRGGVNLALGTEPFRGPLV